MDTARPGLKRRVILVLGASALAIGGTLCTVFRVRHGECAIVLRLGVRQIQPAPLPLPGAAWPPVGGSPVYPKPRLVICRLPVTEYGDGSRRVRVFGPGCHFRRPYPLDVVGTYDSRDQQYRLGREKHDQVVTEDSRQVLVTTEVMWRVGDGPRFLEELGTVAAAEGVLDDIVRSSRNVVLSRYQAEDLISTSPSRLRLSQVEDDMLAEARPVAQGRYGIEIKSVSVKPERILDGH